MMLIKYNRGTESSNNIGETVLLASNSPVIATRNCLRNSRSKLTGSEIVTKPPKNQD